MCPPDGEVANYIVAFCRPLRFLVHANFLKAVSDSEPIEKELEHICPSSLPHLQREAIY